MGYDCYVRRAEADDAPNYLHRTIWISELLERLVEYEMAFWSPPPTWPKLPEPYDEHITHDEAESREVALTDVGRAYLENCEHVRNTHGETRTQGIPTHKFSSNDGWHVTSDECAQALEAYGKAREEGRSHPDEFYDDLIPFLEVAARRDGFEVW